MDTREKVARWLRTRAVGCDEWYGMSDEQKGPWLNAADENLALIGPCEECAKKDIALADSHELLRVAMKEHTQLREEGRVMSKAYGWIEETPED